MVGGMSALYLLRGDRAFRLASLFFTPSTTPHDLRELHPKNKALMKCDLRNLVLEKFVQLDETRL